MIDIPTRFNSILLSYETGRTNYAILSQLSIIFEIPDNIERFHESQPIVTKIEYKHDQYKHAMVIVATGKKNAARNRARTNLS